MDIIEGNKLIDLFMGKDALHANSGRTWTVQYETSWDLLIPAIRKFKDLTGQPALWDSNMEEIEDAVTDEFDILQAWQALVNAIKWYNQTL